MGSQSKLLEGLHTTVDILILDYTLPYKPLASFLSLSLSLSLLVDMVVEGKATKKIAQVHTH